MPNPLDIPMAILCVASAFCAAKFISLSFSMLKFAIRKLKAKKIKDGLMWLAAALACIAFAVEVFTGPKGFLAVFKLFQKWKHIGPCHPAIKKLFLSSSL